MKLTKKEQKPMIVKKPDKKETEERIHWRSIPKEHREIINAYEKEKLSLVKVGARFGFSAQWCSVVLKKYGVPRRGFGPVPKQINRQFRKVAK